MVSGDTPPPHTNKSVTLQYLDVVDQQHDILGQVKVAQVEHDGVAHHRLPQDPVDLHQTNERGDTRQTLSCAAADGDTLSWTLCEAARQCEDTRGTWTLPSL